MSKLFRMDPACQVFKQEMLDQTESDLKDKSVQLIAQLKTKVNKWKSLLEMAEEDGLVPGAFDVNESKIQKLNPVTIITDLHFNNVAMELIDLKKSEMQVRMGTRDPKKMAQLYQQLDQAKLTMFQINHEKADLFMAKLKAATEAFLKVKNSE